MTDTTVRPLIVDVLAEHPDWDYLFRKGVATRPPNYQEAAAYEFRYAFPEWAPIVKLAEDGLAFESSPARAGIAWTPKSAPVPEPACTCDCQAEPVKPDGIGDLDKGQREAADRFDELHDHEDRRTATSVMDAVDADPTELVPVVEPDGGAS